MGSFDIYGDGAQKRFKVWRYPGVPIPFRLQGKYKDFSLVKGKR